MLVHLSRQTLFLVLLVLLIALGALAFTFDFVPMPLQAPRVVQIEPADNATEIFPGSPITITFSTAMDQTQTVKAVTTNPPTQGLVYWQDERTLIFVPQPPLPISTTVTLGVSPAARSWIQRPLQTQTLSRFTTLTRPVVLTSTPAPDAQFAYIPDQVTIVFNRAMDSNTLADSLQVKPEPENYSFSLRDSTLTLGGFFAPRTQYHITIPAFEGDARYGIPLGHDYVWAFTAATEYPNFSILNRGRVLTFPPNAPIEIPTQYTNVSRLDVAVYAISPQEFDENANAPFETWYVFQPATLPVQTSSIKINAVLDTYTQQRVPLEPLPQGMYYLKMTAPEGVSDKQLLRIE